MKAIFLFLCILGCSSAMRRDLFGTTTFYEWIQSLNVSAVVADDLNTFPTDNGGTCKAVQFTGVLRHGIDFPKAKDMVKIESLHRLFKDSIVDKYTDIKQWQRKFRLDQADQLAPAGAMEHRGIGAIFTKRLKTLFSDARNSTQFIASYQPRAINSAKNFHVGMEEILSGNTVVSNISIKIDNMVTRFAYSCQKFIKTVLENKTARAEEKKFEHGRHVANVTQSVNTRLFGGNLAFLDYDAIQDIMKFCAREMGFYGSSVWCQLFDDWELEIQEYLNDLYRYYAYGYGYKINYEQSCPLFGEMFHNLDAYAMAPAVDKAKVSLNKHPQRYMSKEINKYAKSNQSTSVHQEADLDMVKWKAKLIFTHGATMIPLNAALGLYKDKVPLTADNFDTQRNRKYYMSRIAPAASNIAMVLYECSKPVTVVSDGRTFHSTYAVKLFGNQYEKEFPGCKSKLCPYTFVRHQHEELIDRCHYDERCKVPEDPSVVG